jgi:hypothetical protein
LKQGENSESLIRLWRGRMLSAKARYDLAASRVRMAFTDYRAAAIPAPDGDYAYRQALQEERAAMREYSTALKFCYDLLLEDKTPDEDAWLEAKGGDPEPKPGA